MKIILNGQERVLDGSLSIGKLIANLELDPKIVAIEQNRAIVPASEFESTQIVEGDYIEIVQFIGGG